MSTLPEGKGPKVPPSYPPNTPKPQKKPVEAPRPQPAAKPTSALLGPRPRMRIRNRRTTALTFRADAWAAGKAAARTLAQVGEWGYAAAQEDLLSAVRLLVEGAVTGGGKRVSVHLADQDGLILIVALSHQLTSAQTVVGQRDGLLAQLVALRTVDSCGTDTAEDGHRLWALLDAAPPPHRPGTTTT
ncbi:hypothetical protein [Streptomyces sp. NPDC060031]|uniref:hypothetical protein n=1 Tax=Streptomyces sp. NPDC060031 TaxID=3347043 RepID=UPI0036AB1963